MHAPLEADLALLHKLPSLRAYIASISAEPRSFRRFVVYGEKTYNNLRKEIAVIQLKRDGTIDCDNPEYAPTDEQRRTIAAELTSVTLPKHIAAWQGQVDDLREKLGAEHAMLFEYRTAAGDEIIWVQQRKETVDGKVDLPWTFFDDGQWRCMEPDGSRPDADKPNGLLPLYGLEQLKKCKPIIMHEGAKTAAHVQWLTSDNPEAKAELAKHPWGQTLAHYVHLGWPGGAPNPHRVDWGPIKSMDRYTRVILVCDRDQVGEDAAAKISRSLGRSLDVVLFDHRHPETFDLADPWPAVAEWWRGKLYVGPTLEESVVSGTWATEPEKTGARGKPRLKLRPEFASEWLWSVKPPLIANITRRDQLLSISEFNNAVAPFSDSKNTAELLMKHISARCDGIIYRPELNSEQVRVEHGRNINTYRPAEIKPVRGDIGPFSRYLEHLFSHERDRYEVMRWCATLIARPDVRMSYGLLMVSDTQGVGKTTLAEAILAPLIGRWNVATVTDQMINGDFNGWNAHKRLLIINEIYSGQTRKTYDNLKSVITDQFVRVNEKFKPAYELENWAHVIASSNSIRALHLDDQDRRWLVPRVTEKLPINPEIYWRDFHGWIKGDGLPIIAHWAKEFLRQDENRLVATGQRAPMTSMKLDVINASRSEGQQLAHDLAEMIIARTSEKIVVLMNDVRDWVAAMRNIDSKDKTLESVNTLSKAMKAAGLREPTGTQNGGTPRFKVNGRMTYILANYDIVGVRRWDELADNHRKPEDIWAIPL